MRDDSSDSEFDDHPSKDMVSGVSVSISGSCLYHCKIRSQETNMLKMEKTGCLTF